MPFLKKSNGEEIGVKTRNIFNGFKNRDFCRSSWFLLCFIMLFAYSSYKRMYFFNSDKTFRSICVLVRFEKKYFLTCFAFCCTPHFNIDVLFYKTNIVKKILRTIYFTKSINNWNCRSKYRNTYACIHIRFTYVTGAIHACAIINIDKHIKTF